MQFKCILVCTQGPLMSIAYKEGIKINGQAMQELIQASGQDIRQVSSLWPLVCICTCVKVLHNLSLWSGVIAKTAGGVKKEVLMVSLWASDRVIMFFRAHSI